MHAGAFLPSGIEEGRGDTVRRFRPGLRVHCRGDDGNVVLPREIGEGGADCLAVVPPRPVGGVSGCEEFGGDDNLGAAAASASDETLERCQVPSMSGNPIRLGFRPRR